MKTKFQSIIKKVSQAELARLRTNNSATSVVYEMNLDENIDKRYNKLTDIFIYTSANWSNNQNGEVVQPLMVDANEIFPVGFDTFLAFPMKQNTEFTQFEEAVPVHNSKLEGRIKFELPYTETANYKLVVVLKLEKDSNSQNIR